MNAFDWKARVGQATKDLKRSETARNNAVRRRDPLAPCPFHTYSKAVPSVPNRQNQKPD